MFFVVVGHFRFVFDVPEAWEVFKNLAEARGFVVLRYQPVASHGDLIQARNHKMFTFLDISIKCK